MSQIIQRNLQKTRKETIAVSDDKQIRFDVSVDHGSFSPSHWHEAIEIIYVLEGTAVVTLFDLTITLEPGQMLLINSGLVHASRCPSGNRTILMQIPDDLLLSFLPDVLAGKQLTGSAGKAIIDRSFSRRAPFDFFAAGEVFLAARSYPFEVRGISARSRLSPFPLCRGGPACGVSPGGKFFSGHDPLV